MKRYLVNALCLFWMLCSLQVYASEQEKVFKVLECFLSGTLFKHSREIAEEIFEQSILKPLLGDDYNKEKKADVTIYKSQGSLGTVFLNYTFDKKILRSISWTTSFEDFEGGQKLIKKMMGEHNHYEFYKDVARSDFNEYDAFYYGSHESLNASLALSKSKQKDIEFKFQMNEQPNIETLTSMMKFYENKDLFSMTMMQLKSYLATHKDQFSNIHTLKDLMAGFDGLEDGLLDFTLFASQNKGSETIRVGFNFNPQTQQLSNIDISLPLFQRYKMHPFIKKAYGYEGPIYKALILNEQGNARLDYLGGQYHSLLNPVIKLFGDSIYREPIQYLCETKTIGEEQTIQELAFIGLDRDKDPKMPFIIWFEEQSLHKKHNNYEHDTINPNVLYMDQDEYNGLKDTMVRKLIFDEPVSQLLKRSVEFQFEVYYSERSRKDKTEWLKNTSDEMLKEGTCRPAQGP